MSDWSKRYLQAERAMKRQEREAVKRARELERQAKEEAKADERTMALLQVQAHESRLEVLLSLHREVGKNWDWRKLAATLPPHPPGITNERELRTQQNLMILPANEQESWERIIEQARQQDRFENEMNRKSYEEKLTDWNKLTALARRIVAGDTTAYRDAIEEFSPLAEMAELGSSIDFIMHSPKCIECTLTMKDSSVIPAETKSLTASGKLSVKPMPRQSFHEIYQDYICGGILRVARESFALLPIDRVLITAVTTVVDITGIPADKAVLSVILTRSDIDRLDFARIDPSVAIDSLTHRGDFKATRKTGAFLPIEPFTCSDAEPASEQDLVLADLLLRAANTRNELKEELNKLQESTLS